jgi:hypothetical protein
MGSRKPLMKSKTIRVGAVYGAVGLAGVVLQFLGLLKQVLESINLETVPPESAAWFSAILGLTGAIMAILRVVTKEPLDI